MTTANIQHVFITVFLLHFYATLTTEAPAAELSLLLQSGNITSSGRSASVTLWHCITRKPS